MRILENVTIFTLACSALAVGCATSSDDESAAPGVASIATQALPLSGQGVECFVFDDDYDDVEGPSGAVYFNDEGLACIPDPSPGGLCRKWFGRCRTTDPSHTPVEFAVGDVSPLASAPYWYGWADAVYSHHWEEWWTEHAETCVPNGTTRGLCGEYFGNARTTGSHLPVRCRSFDDNYTSVTALSDRMTDITRSRVWSAGTGGAQRKWFGECEVGGCGDGFCSSDEDTKTCPNDCTCGNGTCGAGEDVRSCRADCFCGNGTCDPGEGSNDCPKDCGGCGDGVCSPDEKCACAEDCGACAPTTCSGDKATASATYHTVLYEDGYSCANSIAVFANSAEEAAECVVAAGGKVVKASTATTVTFHTDPKYGCAEISFVAFSESSAARCAEAQGYTFPGPCPR